MSLVAIARADFRDARRSRILWGATLVLALFVGLFLSSTGGSGDTAGVLALLNLLGVAGLLVPLVAVFIGALSIAGAHESGRIRYVLGLPTARWAIVGGTALSRAMLAAIAVGVALLVGAGVLVWRTSTVPIRPFLVVSLLTLLLAVGYAAIGVAVSAACASRGRALAASVSIYLLTSVLWSAPPIDPRSSLPFLVEEVLAMGPRPDLYSAAFHLSPVVAHDRATTAFLGVDGITTAVPPIYLAGESMLAVLVAWPVGALIIGYLWFRRIEIQ